MNIKQERFAKEYLIDLNATQAAVRAGYSVKTAKSQGQRLLTHVDVKKAIQKLMDERAANTEITAERVLRELWNIAMADTSEIAEHRRVCCRYCWGKDFQYQYTPAELGAAKEAYWARVEASKPGVKIAPFTERGGSGFDSRRKPNPKCPECNGEGHSVVFVKDTRNLSPAVKSLFAGVRQTKDGVEVKTHPKDKALELLGRHLKLFVDKVEVEDMTDLGRRMNAARDRLTRR